MISAVRNYQKVFSNYNWGLLTKSILDQQSLKTIVDSVLPFTILATPQVGRALHCVLTLGGIAQNIKQFQAAKNLRNAGNIVRQASEIAAHFFDNRLGLIVHNAFGAAEHCYNFIQDDSSKRLENGILALSSILSAATFLKLSKKNSLTFLVISGLFQACSNFHLMCKAGKEVYAEGKGWRNIKVLTILSKGVMGAIHLTHAHACFQELQKIQRVVQQIFIIMRHADRGKEEFDPSITEKGKLRARASAGVICEIAKEHGKEGFRLVVSSLKRSQETGACIAEVLQIDPQSIHQDARIRELDHSGIPRAIRKQSPQYQAYKNLTDEQVKFRTSQTPGTESGEDLFLRVKEGVTDALDVYQSPTTLTVFVAHQKAIKAFFTGLFFQSDFQDPSPSFLKGGKYCEIFVVARQNGRFIGIRRMRVGVSS